MCGRFVSASPVGELARFFAAERLPEAALPPRWNVAPTDPVHMVVVDGGDRRLAVARWGLVPSWAGPSIGARLINARAERLATSSAFAPALRHRRCIVPADGFYEWVAGPADRRQPVFVHHPDDRPLAFAGLWEWWQDRSGSDVVLRSCTIVTTRASADVAPVHDRMPVVLAPSTWDQWLDPGQHDADRLARLLVPSPEGSLVRRSVGTAVNRVGVDGPELVAAVGAGSVVGGQGTLF